MRDFGAVGDGIADDTVAIQAALDGAAGTFYFPSGSYRVSGSGEAILTLGRNVNIEGSNIRNCRIIGFVGTPSTSLFKVSITQNWGLGSIKGWNMKNLPLTLTARPMASTRYIFTAPTQGLVCSDHRSNHAGLRGKVPMADMGFMRMITFITVGSHAVRSLV